MHTCGPFVGARRGSIVHNPSSARYAFELETICRQDVGMEITFTGDTVAWWGAVTGTAGLLLSGYEVLRDRAKLVIKFSTGWDASALPGYSADHRYHLVEVCNVGRRTVAISKGWIDFGSNEGFGFIGDSARTSEIAEGRSAKWLLREDQIVLSLIVAICVDDQTGRTWRTKVKVPKGPTPKRSLYGKTG